MTWSRTSHNSCFSQTRMPRNRKRNSKAKRAQLTHRDANANRPDTVWQSGNASNRGAAASGYNSPSSRASIHSLPPELLCETFILAFHSDHELIHPDPSPRLTKTPFTFCAVCSLWRSLAFSIPQLTVGSKMLEIQFLGY